MVSRVVLFACLMVALGCNSPKVNPSDGYLTHDTIVLPKGEILFQVGDLTFVTYDTNTHVYNEYTTNGKGELVYCRSIILNR